MPRVKILLDESEIPTNWYNVVADLPKPPAPLLGGDGKPVNPESLAAIFPRRRSSNRKSRASDGSRFRSRCARFIGNGALLRCSALAAWKKRSGRPRRVYYKYEGVSPAGSHKPNTAVPQAYYNRLAGVRRIATETGAGQWGSALAMAGQMFGIEVRVYMVRVSYEQKPFRRSMMEAWGAEVIASPSTRTNAGRHILEQHPDSTGSLGIAISEAVEEAATRTDTNYALGSVLNHVLLHQTVIGLEAKKQFEKVGDYPDVIIACCGGGLEFRRRRVSIFRRQGRGQAGASDRGRARVMSDVDARPLCLRLRRHRGPHSADADVHAGAQFRAALDSRRRSALSRRLAAGVAASS